MILLQMFIESENRNSSRLSLTRFEHQHKLKGLLRTHFGWDEEFQVVLLSTLATFSVPLSEDQPTFVPASSPPGHVPPAGERLHRWRLCSRRLRRGRIVVRTVMQQTEGEAGEAVAAAPLVTG